MRQGDPDERETAWFELHDALPAFWHVGPCTFDPAHQRWMVTARSATRGRGSIPTTVTGTGVDELTAVRDLNGRLRGYPRPPEDEAKKAALDRRLRLAFVRGAEEWSRPFAERPLTNQELEAVTAQFRRSVR